MTKQPTLETERLRLRPFTLADASEVHRLLGERDIASTTLNIPYPYKAGMAEEWIATHRPGYERGELFNFALVTCSDDRLIGAMGLRASPDHAHAELGYWIGKVYWNRGYATEAAEAIIWYAFDEVGLNRVHASHLSRNLASGRVMQKVGMIHEGRLRQHIRKWGVFEDLELYGILRSDYESRRK